MGFSNYTEKIPPPPHSTTAFEQAISILGLSVSLIVMFEGTAETLKENPKYQPAYFLHSVIMSKVNGESLNPIWLQTFL